MTNKELSRAGEALRSAPQDSPEYADALSLVNAWRSLHKKPLNTFQVSLKKFAKEIDIEFLFAQRLKKMKSIKEKLIRFPKTQLHRMQDIGGCRVILSDTEKVYQLKDVFLKRKVKHILERETDYIKSPKPSGYRGIHLVFKYSSSDETINGMRIEIQLRSRLQHIWATAVETASLISETNLKASDGKTDWLRFFALVSSYFALTENREHIPETPNDKAKITEELKALEKKNSFLAKFETLNAFGRYSESEELFGSDNYYLLYINKKERLFRATGYKQYKKAYNEYVSWEKKENGIDNVVLVSTSSFDGLQRAYPNYFADMSEFISALKNILS